MTLDWSDYPDAPQPGAFLCAMSEIPQQGVLSAALDGFLFLVVLSDHQPRAFVNACPHQFLPLDHRSTSIQSADGKHLLCSNHGAVFRITDGVGTKGEGMGCALSPIPVTVQSGRVEISA